MERFRTKNGLSNATEVWLHSLRYYLDTPHWSIISHASQMHKKYGKNGVWNLAKDMNVDPEAEYVHSLAYQSQADNYFLCIWEAVEGEEFILSHTGFGLWEGTMAGSPGLHRLFPTSLLFSR